MADNPYAKYVQQDEPNPYEKYLKPEGAFDEFSRIAADPEGGVLPAIGGLIARALPEGGGKRTAGGFAKDTAVDAVRGVVGLGQGVVGLGNLVSFGALGKGMEALGYNGEQTQKFLGGLYTADRQQAEKNVENAKGFFDTLGALAVNPSVVLGSVIQAVPQTVAAGAAGGAMVRAMLPGATKAAQAAGVAGDDAAKFIADYVAKRAPIVAGASEGALTAGSIAESGREAGQDFTTYAPAALAGGAVTGIIGAASGVIGRRVGLGDIEADIAMRSAGVTPTTAAAAGGRLKTIGKEALKEGLLEEAPQSFQEALATQYAQGKPFNLEEAASQAAQGLATGGAMGGFNAAIRGRAPEGPKTQGPAPDAGIDQSLDRLQAARDAVYLGGQSSAETIGNVLSAPTPNGDIGAAIIAAEQATSTPIGTLVQEGAARGGAYLAPLMDRQAELTQLANEAGTSFDRQSALDQAAVSLEQNLPARQGVADQYADLSPMDERTAQGRLKALRDMTANEGGDALSLSVVPHPGVEGKFAIGRQALPALELPTQQPAEVSQQDAQQRLATASVQGDFNQSRESFENKLQQQGLTRALQSIEQRNGVATPEEAQLLDRFYPGQKLYDSIQGQPAAAAPQASARDEAVGEARAQLIQQRMDRQAGLGQPETPTQPLVLDNGVRQREPGRENRLERVNSSVEYIPAPGIQATTSLGAAPESQPGIQPNAPLDVATPRDAKPTNTDGLSLVPVPTASESASDARMAELQAQRQQKQTEQDASNAAAAAKQPAAPTVNQTIAALRTIPALRTAEQKAVVSTAMARMTPDQIGLLQRAATMPQGLSSEERLQLRGMRDSEVKASEQRADATTAASEATQQGKPVSTLGNITVVDPTTLSTQSKTSGGTISRQTHRMVSLMGSMFGKKVVLFSSDNDMAPDGFVRKGDSRTIHLNVKSQVSHLVVFGHELLHQLKADNSGAYDALAKVIKLKAGADTNVAGIRGDMEELTADVVGNRFRETEFWQDVFREILASGTDQRVSQKSAMRLGASVVRAVDKMVKALKGMTGFSTDSMVENLAEVKTAVTKALASYAQEKRGEATQLIQEERNALGQESQQGSVQQERGSRNEIGRASEAGPGDRLLSTAQSQAAEGEKRQSVEERIRAAGAAARSEMGLRFSDKRPGQMDNVEAYHYSQAPRRTLSSSMFGTGLKGSGREEYLNAQDQRRRQRISFYFDKGTGVRPEAGLGGYPHKASLNNVYDINEDPLNLRAGTQAQTEKNVLDAGFNGYMDRMDGTQPGQVVMLGKQDIPVQPLPPGTKIKPGATYNTVETSKTWAPIATNLTREEAQQRVSRMKATIGWRGYEIRVVPAGPRMAIEVLPIPEPEVRGEAGVRASDKRDPLPGAPDIEGATGPDVALVAVAEKYARDNGIDLKRQSEYVDVNENFARLVSREWERVEHSPNDPRVRRAYAELARQTMAQYKALTDAGYKFWFYGENNDPYNENPWNAMRALREDKAMAVFSTKEGYGNKFKDSLANGGPMLADTGLRWGMGSENGPKETVYFNDLFRAVHDAFGHGIEGSGFRARGEENAWQAHVRLFTGDAIGALTSETRGQNSWLNYGPFGLANRTAKVKKVVFADQKVGLMPSWTWTELRVGDMAEQGDDVLASAKRVVNTPEFKRWFGDSKVVDGRGRPLVVYHGTADDFSTFKYNEVKSLGIWFATEPELAGKYAEIVGRDGKSYSVMPVYLSLQNPANADDLQKATEEAEKEKDRNWGKINKRRREILQSKGFDGVMLSDTVVVFDPTQIKSAIGNSGAFDPTNPDIRKSEKRILLNIGLSTKEVKGGGLLTEDVVLSALTKLGLTVDSMPVHPSDTEPTAIPAIDRPLTQEEGDDLSVRLNQQSIVQRMPDGSGVLFGPMADEWAPYNPAYFVMRDGRYAIEHEAEVKASAKRPGATRPVRQEVADVADISNARQIATSRTWATNRDFKLALQDAVRAVARTVDLSVDTPQARAYITRQLLKEAREALITNANAVGWYDEKVTTALEVMSEIHPELKTDPQAQFAFIWALAVTSNGIKVNRNFQLAERAYSLWKASNADVSKRRMPTIGIGEGTAASKINAGLETYNKLVSKWGYDRLKSFATTLQPNRQVAAAFGRKVSGEGMDTQVYGAGILGPKIGNGFFMNLFGEFGQLTMDRWWVRMWGRITGDLVEIDREKIKTSREAFVSMIDMIKSDRVATRAVEQAIGSRLGKGNPVEMAKTIIRVTQDEDVRKALTAILPANAEREAAVLEARGKIKDFVSVADELRKAAKTFYVNLDGQIEVPGGSRRRDMMRAISQAVLTELQKEHPHLTMADFQALMWYPEKTLYDSAGAQSETSEEGYEDDEAPDYANAAIALAREKKVSNERINAAVERARSDIASRQRSGRGGRAAVGVPSQDRNGSGANTSGAPEVKASEKRPVLKEDIPNEDWLQGKINYAIKKGRNQWGVPHMSTVTGYFDKPVEVSLRVLSRLKGQRDEQNNARQDSLKYIRENWDEVSQNPPYIEVAYNGEAWVSEGNHRIMVAAEKGLQSMPVEIRYFDGGQRRSGPLAPNRISSLDPSVIASEKRSPGRGYVTADEISKMYFNAWGDLKRDKKYIELSKAVEDAEAANNNRFQAVHQRAIEILKSRPGFAKIANEYDEKTIGSLARVFMDQADEGVPQASPSVQDAARARQDYVDYYFKKVAKIPEPGPFSEQANQQRSYYNSPSFKRWFKASKVVDKQGNPLVAFHVTSSDFVEFDTAAGAKAGKKTHAAYSGQLGSWFTAPSLYEGNYDAGNAENAVEQFIEDRDGAFKDGANTMLVHLSIQNPMEYPDFESMLEDRDSFKSIAAYKKSLVEQGHDGIVIRNSDTDGGVDRDDWVAFEPTQIKSAIGNNGNFDPTNPDIRKSEKRDQDETPPFERWFGDSKVVDEDGDPLEVYHGTANDFDAFDFTRGGHVWGASDSQGVMWFSSYIPRANAAARDAAQVHAKDDEAYDAQTGSNVMPVYLRMERPYRLTRKEMLGDTAAAIKAAREAGYDGVVMPGEMGGEDFAVFEPTQIKSAIGNNGNFDPTNPDIRKSEKRIFDASGRTYTPEQKALFENVGRTQEVMTLRERIANLRKDLGKKLAQGIADQFMPIKELGRYGKEAYMLARLSKGTAGAVEALLHHGKLKLVDGVYDADQTGGALNEVFMPLRNETSDWLWWVAANRADRLAKEDRENLFTPQGIAAGKTLSDGTTNFDYTLRNGQVTRDRTLIFRDALQKYDEFNQNVLDIAEQSGLISSDVRSKIAHAMYVPFYRQSEDGTAAFAGGASGAIVRQEAFKALKGGTDKLQSDLLQNVLSNWGHIIDASAKNRAALASVKAAEDMGVAIEADEATVRDMAKASGNRKGVVWVKDQGEKRFFLVEDPYVLSAITSLEYSGMKGPIMDALSAFKHALTIGVTASPAFKIRNLIRDSVQAVASAPLSANLLQNLRDGVAASNKDTQTYVSALASGGLIRFGTMLEGSASARMRQLIRMGTSEDTILNSDNKVQAVRDKFEKYFMAYSELGNRSEEINRSALYKQLTDKGVSHAEASLAARDLMDFSMQGTWTSVRFLTQVVPFMNARIQGLYKLGRAAKEDPRRFAAVLGAVTLASIALAAAYKDDDDWKKREDWDRDNFWWFKVGGVAYRIPKPFEIGAVATMAERGADFLWDKNMTGARYGKIVKDLLMDNLSFSPIPQGVKPILDVYANKDSFTGRPIETMGMERLAPDYRFNQGTSMFSRALSTAGQSVVNATGLNKAGAAMLSPIQVDHLIQGYFGWLGSFVVGGSDMALRPLTGQPARPTADYYKLATQGIVQEVSSGSSYFVSSLYDQAKVLDQSYATWRELLKQNKVQEAKEYFDSNKADIIRARSVDRVKSGEAKFNEMIRMIERSSKDPDVKKAEIQKVRDMQDRLARVLTEVR